MRFSISLEPGFVLEITETVPKGTGLVLTLKREEGGEAIALGLEERETLLRALGR